MKTNVIKVELAEEDLNDIIKRLNALELRAFSSNDIRLNDHEDNIRAAGVRLADLEKAELDQTKRFNTRISDINRHIASRDEVYQDAIRNLQDSFKAASERFAAIEANIDGFSDRIGELEDRHEDEDEAAASLVEPHSYDDSSPREDEYDEEVIECYRGTVATLKDRNASLRRMVDELRAELANRDARHAGIRAYRDKQDARINQLEGTLSMLHCQIEELKAQRDAGEPDLDRVLQWAHKNPDRFREIIIKWKPAK